MKILIAADKFKGSLSSEAACNSIAAGIRQVDSSADVMEFPMADGGDGFVLARVAWLSKRPWRR